MQTNCSRTWNLLLFIWIFITPIVLLVHQCLRKARNQNGRYVEGGGANDRTTIKKQNLLQGAYIREHTVCGNRMIILQEREGCFYWRGCSKLNPPRGLRRIWPVGFLDVWPGCLPGFSLSRVHIVSCDIPTTNVERLDTTSITIFITSLIDDTIKYT